MGSREIKAVVLLALGALLLVGVFLIFILFFN